MSVNLEDLDVDFVLQHFILCLFVNEDDDETELQSYQRRGFLSVFESFIAVNKSVKKTKIDWQIFEKKQEKQGIPSTNKIKKTSPQIYVPLIILTSSLAICKLFSKTKERKMEATPSQT